MTYTRTWNENLPDGNEDSDTIDDEIRALKVDFRERLETLPGVDLDNDPIYSIPVDIQHWAAGAPRGDSGWTGHASGHYLNPSGTSTTFVWAHSIKAIIGKTIDSVKFYVNRVNGSAAISLFVYKTDLATGTTTAVGSLSVSSTGYSEESITASLVMVAGYAYHAMLSLTSDGATADTARHYGIKVTYS